MTDEERKQLGELAVKLEYLAHEGVHFTREDHRIILLALGVLGQAHNSAMYQLLG